MRAQAAMISRSMSKALQLVSWPSQVRNYRDPRRSDAALCARSRRHAEAIHRCGEDRDRGRRLHQNQRPRRRAAEEIPSSPAISCMPTTARMPASSGCAALSSAKRKRRTAQEALFDLQCLARWFPSRRRMCRLALAMRALLRRRCRAHRFHHKRRRAAGAQLRKRHLSAQSEPSLALFLGHDRDEFLVFRGLIPTRARGGRAAYGICRSELSDDAPPRESVEIRSVVFYDQC